MEIVSYYNNQQIAPPNRKTTMPMIELQYDQEVISTAQVQRLAPMLHVDLRSVIRPLRREKGKNYGVTVEGRPFGPVTLFLPALLIHIYYHEDWQFTEEELHDLATNMRAKLDERLGVLKLRDLTSKIRFYCRTGHVSS